jgi:hypothetical protein
MIIFELLVRFVDLNNFGLDDRQKFLCSSFSRGLKQQSVKFGIRITSRILMEMQPNPASTMTCFAAEDAAQKAKSGSE